MRRLWIILAALAMLTQWSYAAAGAYCPHEREQPSAAGHWGHHLHSHAGPEQGTDPPDSAGGFDGDCAFCHAACAFGPLPFFAPGPADRAAPLNAAVAWRLAGRWAETPERPQWPAPALA